jgi:hypothetical protein
MMLQESSVTTTSSEEENHSVAMINEMVRLAVLLRRISKEIYHNPRGYTMPHRSSIALSIDALLEGWKDNLPEWLRFDHVSLRESESAAKQRLVLQLRYLNTRAILHRPFLAGLADDTEPNKRAHVSLCLTAARETIVLLHESYKTRHYFRTWWYNSTYTLYAGMIVLYVMMFGQSDVSHDDLEKDVVQSQNVLRSMEEASVARRSADLMTEVLDVARSYTQQGSNATHMMQTGSTEVQSANRGDQESSWPMPAAPSDPAEGLFPQTETGQDPSAIFASITDLDTLMDFTQFMGNDLPTESFLFSDYN